ncbi:MAG: class II aldolase/adducin family protein [Gammaproteobacteria bacterium]|nr:class II aldolase/adducin family protein [Gammaproteobacteria bacterium]
MNELDIRKKIIEMCLRMNATGLNQGTSGNISARVGDQMLITPSGIPYEELEPEHIAAMSVSDDAYEWEGPFKPSSEWHFHRAILQSNANYGAVIHTHSMYSTILSIGRREIPPCHYMIAAFGGTTVRCADYATYGTKELSNNIIAAMKDRSACLMANHGMVVAGSDLDKTMWAAVELETLSKQYYHADMAKSMHLLSDEEMDVVLKAFYDYGPKDVES